jgi:hypothetical protein
MIFTCKVLYCLALLLMLTLLMRGTQHAVNKNRACFIRISSTAQYDSPVSPAQHDSRIQTFGNLPIIRYLLVEWTLLTLPN